MVKDQIAQQSEKSPPPMEESWWEAILAEEYQLIPSNQQGIAEKGSEKKYVKNRIDSQKKLLVDWERVSQLYDGDDVVQMLVTGNNRGGLLVEGDGLQGFVPISHLLDIRCETENEIEACLEAYCGKTLHLKVIECDKTNGRVVFSERAAQTLPGSRIQLMKRISPGDCVTGKVTNITNFGIFVDLGGIEGLVHVSEISWGRVHHPSDVVALNQDIRVYVIQVDQARSRVALSLKRLSQNPWETAQDRYFPGQLAEAVVTSIVPFGAFARLEEGLDGLIHISEMNSTGKDIKPEEILKEGQRIQVRVIHIDASRQRLGLSVHLDD